MTTLPVIDYYYTFLKKSSGTWTDFSGMAFEKFELLNDLNIKHTKSSMTDTNEAIAAMLEVKDPKEFMEFAQRSTSPLPAKLSAYIKDVYKINSLELSFYTYLGLFFILIGLIVRIDFKVIIQKDIQ